jgi:hypothetical protein
MKEEEKIENDFYDESRSRWIITTDNVLKVAEGVSNILQGIEVREYIIKFILIGKTSGYKIAATSDGKFVLLRANRELR